MNLDFNKLKCTSLHEMLDHDQPKLQVLPTPQGVVVIKNNSIIVVIKQASPVFEVKWKRNNKSKRI